MPSPAELHVLSAGDRIFFVQDFNFFSDVPDINCLTEVDLLKYGRFYKVMHVVDRSYMLPQLGFATQRYIKYIALFKQSTEIIDYESKHTYERIDYKGLVQPLKPRELALKPEEQRAFNWLKITTFALNGNIQYHLVETYIDRKQTGSE